jgi:hypothetical protein
MARGWEALLQRWREAGLIDAETTAAIESWEQAQGGSKRLAVPVQMALFVGGLLLAAGLLLFVSAHWDTLGPGQRFALVLSLVLGLHAAAAAVSPRFGRLGLTLHGVGTVALGAGIFLTGQIFHLEAHWPAGLLLWALGAGIGWGVLRQWPQLLLLALLTPLWLNSEWLLACNRLLMRGPGGTDLDSPSLWLVPSAAWLLLSLAAFNGGGHRPGAAVERQVPLGLGGLALLPAAGVWAGTSVGIARISENLPLNLRILGWGVALGGPLLLGWWLRRRAFWPLGVATGWMLVGLALGQISTDTTPIHYLWWGTGALLLIGWGVLENHPTEINLGSAAVALVVLSFYFSEVMDKLDRSVSLAGLGVLFLAGGWGLERWRRRLVSRTRRGAP